MKKLLVKQIKSDIGSSPKQKNALKALGLGRIGKSRVLDNSSSIEGLVKIVNHLIEKSYVNK